MNSSSSLTAWTNGLSQIIKTGSLIKAESNCVVWGGGEESGGGGGGRRVQDERDRGCCFPSLK